MVKIMRKKKLNNINQITTKMEKRTNLSMFVFFALIMCALLIQTKQSFSQQEDPNNARTWKYFKVLARAEDDSIFIIAQDDMGIDPKLESYSIVVR
jgi:hypothetical protein